MKLSVSSYSFASAIGQGKIELIDTIRLAKEIGFEGIEFTDFNLPLDDALELAKKFKAEAKKYGIKIIGYCVGANLYSKDKAKMQEEIAKVKEKILVAKELGAFFLRHDVCYDEKEGTFFEMLPTIAENAKEITEFAKKNGIITMTENHGFVAQDSNRVEALIKEVGDENYSLLIDMGNFACVDENNLSAVKKLLKYAKHVHAKDFYISDKKIKKEGWCFNSRGGKFLLGSVVGEGDINAKACIDEIKSSGYDGYISIEYEGGEDAVESIKKGFDFLKRNI